MSHTWRNPILQVKAFHRNDRTIRKIIPPDSQELSQVEVDIVYSGTMLHWIIHICCDRCDDLQGTRGTVYE